MVKEAIITTDFERVVFFMVDNQYLLRGKCVISISIAFLLIAIGLIIVTDFSVNDFDYQIAYEYVNIKDMATTLVATKEDNSTIIDTLITKPATFSPVEEVSLPLLNNAAANLEQPRQIWYLPVENGVITSTPNYYHVALDITSSRGSNENIYPVANGTISSIYTDSAGAKIVTVLHLIDGVYYTSQYVHLASYAANIYVGKPVTINDCLGKMGATGIATGIHLHIAVVDCALFQPNDPNCADLNGFFNYARVRYNQGFVGLNSVMQVPWSWNSR